ncbi:TPA: hypothetical protein ACSE38_001956 [Acinetobacter baumannii]|uniref:Uncharacterized protein n=13 Tax=Gammaproteobacteria TaxID=1236 RepID=A0A219C991_ACIBA|nr:MULTISPECIES: hypothetical protein [Acinetobacter]ADX91492.1 hypothetical protein ABTW07_1056 [Acinetobacter baumannii TCDC-AB0715]AHX28574.1 hypothetical protein A478_08300 [Acinetobacter baumannii AC12]AHX65877.1 hypothetical protein B856_11445 [Acinetobacter baumannii AC30]EMT87441.1 hypothetical protein ABNIH5_12798 [Acinetobacter baumannii ABNIH5]ETY70229.1 hypothetical protein X964_00405 [Acinetobacter baumannii MDR_MMC4]EXC94786.1 hypothetical protein J484_1931 [Acinetobacter bauman
MNHPNSVLKFSLGLNGMSFDLDNQPIHLEQGLVFINSKSISNGVIDELAIEKMIYFIEEIIESQPLRNLNINGIAVTADTTMTQLSELFFSAKKQISRIELENGFNSFIERLSYYTNQVDPNQLYIFTYFVFIREMMHHLRVEQIQII